MITKANGIKESGLSDSQIMRPTPLAMRFHESGELRFERGTVGSGEGDGFCLQSPFSSPIQSIYVQLKPILADSRTVRPFLEGGGSSIHVAGS